MRTIFVKPAEGLQIRDPIRHDLIEPDGREVEASPYWRRRLLAGDVLEAEPSKPEPNPPAAA